MDIWFNNKCQRSKRGHNSATPGHASPTPAAARAHTFPHPPLASPYALGSGRAHHPAADRPCGHARSHIATPQAACAAPLLDSSTEAAIHIPFHAAAQDAGTKPPPDSVFALTALRAAIVDALHEAKANVSEALAAQAAEFGAREESGSSSDPSQGQTFICLASALPQLPPLRRTTAILDLSM